MFKNLNEVIGHYQRRLEETKDVGRYGIRVLGASIEEIESVEKDLDTPIHSTLRYTLIAVNWAIDSFSNLRVDSVRGLHHFNGPDPDGLPIDSPLKHGYWRVGGSDVYFIYMKIETGNVEAYDVDNSLWMTVAKTMEEFICIAASIVEHQWPDSIKETDKAIATAEAFLDENNISEGRLFWRDLALGWA